jgi:hypothetical protein
VVAETILGADSWELSTVSAAHSHSSVYSEGGFPKMTAEIDGNQNQPCFNSAHVYHDASGTL